MKIPNIPIKNNMINEFTRIWYVHKNIKLKDYVGFCHYSRFFNFYDNVPDINMLFNTHDIIVKKPTRYALLNILTQYSSCHNISDYYIIRKLIHDVYNISYDDIKQCERYLIPCNIFIMPVDKFHEYCEFVSTIIDKYMTLMNFNSYENVKQHVKDNWIFYKKFNATIEYQSRILAFLIERIATIFIKLNFRNPLFIDTDHYNTENNDMNKYFNTGKNNIYHKYE